MKYLQLYKVTESRETQAWYDKRGLKKQRHGMWYKGVQSRDDKKQGTGLALKTQQP